MFAIGGGRKFIANSTGATLLLDSGATESMIDSNLIPGVKAGMRDYKKLGTPKTITVGGITNCHERPRAPSGASYDTENATNNQSIYKYQSSQASDATFSPQLLTLRAA